MPNGYVFRLEGYLNVLAERIGLAASPIDEQEARTLIGNLSPDDAKPVLIDAMLLRTNPMAVGL